MSLNFIQPGFTATESSIKNENHAPSLRPQLWLGLVHLKIANAV